MPRIRTVHFWGWINGERRIAPCVEAPPEHWRVTGILLRVTCQWCIKAIKRETAN